MRTEKRQRNPKVRRVAANKWRIQREEKIKGSIGYAAGAKAYRTALGVTQDEVAELYSVSGAAVCHWESGFYFGWDDDELARYSKVCHQIARANGRS